MNVVVRSKTNSRQQLTAICFSMIVHETKIIEVSPIQNFIFKDRQLNNFPI